MTWESEAVDYPSTGADMPEYEPRGCPRGASSSWYQYSPLRLKYPYVRGSLLQMFREARARLGDPSGKGHEYFLNHLLGTTENAVRAEESPPGAAGGLGGFFPPLVMAVVKSATGSYTLGFILLAAVAVACLIVLQSFDRPGGRPAEHVRVSRPGPAATDH